MKMLDCTLQNEKNPLLWFIKNYEECMIYDHAVFDVEKGFCKATFHTITMLQLCTIAI